MGEGRAVHIPTIALGKLGAALIGMHILIPFLILNILHFLCSAHRLFASQAKAVIGINHACICVYYDRLVVG